MKNELYGISIVYVFFIDYIDIDYRLREGNLSLLSKNTAATECSRDELQLLAEFLCLGFRYKMYFCKGDIERRDFIFIIH